MITDLASLSGPRHVAMVTPEARPFARTGGLGDVLGALPRALEKLGYRMSVVMPAYRSVLQGGLPLEDTGVSLSVPVSGAAEEATLLKARLGDGLTFYFIRADRYFDRDGLYGTPEADYADNPRRFVFLCRAALEALRRDPPQVLHAHDWQSALAVVFLKAQSGLYPELSSAKTVFTVHNLGYQGQFWHLDWHLLGLDWSFFTPRYLEFYQKINFLKGGAVLADAITTVSPTYAEEIKTPEHGFGLDGVFRERAADLIGILNGADYGVWDPATDPLIARPYSASDLSGKQACKAALQATFGLPVRGDVPLLGVLSRLAYQKGFDLLEGVMDDVLRRDVQFVLLGNGERQYEDTFRSLAVRYPSRAGVRIAFDDTLAHQVEAGADMFLMPSRYEPAGLNQIYSLRYGTIPIVRATGGLKDSVLEFDEATRQGTGFRFGPYEPGAFMAAIERALWFFPQMGTWHELMRNAMAADFSWDRSARAYAELYARLITEGA